PGLQRPGRDLQGRPNLAVEVVLQRGPVCRDREEHLIEAAADLLNDELQRGPVCRDREEPLPRVPTARAAWTRFNGARSAETGKSQTRSTDGNRAFTRLQRGPVCRDREESPWDDLDGRPVMDGVCERVGCARASRSNSGASRTPLHLREARGERYRE